MTTSSNHSSSPIQLLIPGDSLGNTEKLKESVENPGKKQAGAELGQAQLKLGFGFTSVYLSQIDELEILLARLTQTTICH